MGDVTVGEWDRATVGLPVTREDGDERGRSDERTERKVGKKTEKEAVIKDQMMVTLNFGEARKMFSKKAFLFSFLLLAFDVFSLSSTDRRKKNVLKISVDGEKRAVFETERNCAKVM